MIKSYLAVQGYMENTIIIERSKFIGYVNYAEDEKQAKDFIEKIKKQNSLATHNCYAYITNLGQFVKFSDDGEPSGTAGMPILEVLKNKNLVNTVVVVTRYFGGIKLGAGGLVRAYTNCVVEALQKTVINKYFLCKELVIDVNYENFTVLQNYLNANNLVIISTDYSENIKIVIAIPVDNYEIAYNNITDFMQGKLKITLENERFYQISI
jgi:uncharacterized YigZ family protein